MPTPAEIEAAYEELILLGGRITHESVSAALAAAEAVRIQRHKRKKHAASNA